METYIYKICPADLWEKAASKGVFKGAGIDLADGYIHFSTADQVAETADLHFSGLEDLVLVKVNTETLDVKWEASRGGKLFPHLYVDLAMDSVIQVVPMPLDEQGLHIFPHEITPRHKK